MLYRLFAFFALVAVAFANPKPEPQVVNYGAGIWPGTYPYYAGAYAAAAPYAFPYAYNGYLIR